MSEYHIERAKSARSSCKKCKLKIEKGELRIGISYTRDEMTMTSYQHPKCFVIPKKLGMDAATFVDDMLEDKTADEVLSNPSSKEQIVLDIGSKGGLSPGKGDTKTESSVSKKIDSYRKALAAICGDEDDERPKKKAKKNKKDDIVLRSAEALRIYEKKKNAELQDVLRWNLGYGMTGTKEVLLLRCIDGHVNGRLSRCPTCFRGRLQLNDDDAGETITCSGYYDEDTAMRIPCSLKVKNSNAPRVKPWYDEKPSEEQMEEIKNTIELQQSKATGGSAGSTPKELIKGAEELDWPDTSTMDGKKKAAKMMLKLCSSGKVVVDLPQDDKKAMMRIGKIIVGNPESASSATVILDLVIKEFGIASEKMELAEQQKDAIASTCACAANAGVLQAFLELSQLYFKEQNSNAGATYKKAANAIMNIPFEITEDNAKGLGKAGKTKVDNIGKSSADKIYEFVTTGTIEKLEEKRMAAS